jgi:hypothetical protein
MIGVDTQKLLALGRILGKDGRPFTKRGEQVMAMAQYDYITVQPRFSVTVQMLVSLWEHREAMDRDSFRSLYDMAGAAYDVVAPSKAMESPMEPWTAHELMRVIIPTAKGCNFCGDRATEQRVLMTCGRCKAALYCDAVCQKMAWRKEHKAVCVAKASRSKDSEKADGGKKEEEGDSNEADAEKTADSKGGSDDVV